MDSFRSIPQVQKILLDRKFEACNRSVVKKIAIIYLQELREKLQENINCDLSINAVCNEIYNRYLKQTSPSLRRLVNATGVVLQTNLGRSLLDKGLIDEITPLLTHYCNIEYDLKNGRRGERYSHINDIFKVMFGVEDVLLVNNNAAAVFLILHTFGKGGEVIISRSELVEIGGSFRIPEIMNNALCTLREVGTTNKTREKDYLNAICENTKILMKTHKSNFTIKGFFEEVDISRISKIAKEHNLIDYYDLGSGYVNGIICDEPSIEKVLENPPSIISFSGDKLFGGPQVGIIVGKSELIEKLKQNQLLRILRVDKITLCVLQATLSRYLQNRLNEIPTIKMLSICKEDLKCKAESLCKQIEGVFNPIVLEVSSLAGGGSLPECEFSSFGVGITCSSIKASVLEEKLRAKDIIARILNNRIIFDMRTIQDDDDKIILQALREIQKEIDG